MFLETIQQLLFSKFTAYTIIEYIYIYKYIYINTCDPKVMVYTAYIKWRYTESEISSFG